MAAGLRAGCHSVTSSSVATLWGRGIPELPFFTSSADGTLSKLAKTTAFRQDDLSTLPCPSLHWRAHRPVYSLLDERG